MAAATESKEEVAAPRVFRGLSTGVGLWHSPFRV